MRDVRKRRVARAGVERHVVVGAGPAEGVLEEPVAYARRRGSGRGGRGLEAGGAGVERRGHAGRAVAAMSGGGKRPSGTRSGALLPPVGSMAECASAGSKMCVLSCFCARFARKSRQTTSLCPFEAAKWSGVTAGLPTIAARGAARALDTRAVGEELWKRVSEKRDLRDDTGAYLGAFTTTAPRGDEEVYMMGVPAGAGGVRREDAVCWWAGHSRGRW
jgi:hypothetical protein